jgi:hypothetical protein
MTAGSYSWRNFHTEKSRRHRHSLNAQFRWPPESDEEITSKLDFIVKRDYANEQISR